LTPPSLSAIDCPPSGENPPRKSREEAHNADAKSRAPDTCRPTSHQNRFRLHRRRRADQQTWLLSADGSNNEIRVLKRDDGTVVGTFGRNGRNAGQFHWIHAMAVDSKGNVYTAEVDTGKRIQKFKLTSDALR